MFTSKESKTLSLIKDESQKLMKQVGDPVHNWRHVQNVVKFSNRLLSYYPLADQFTVITGAYLHDIGLRNGREKHHIKGADLAGEILLSCGCEKSSIKKIQAVIKDHRAFSKPKTIESKIVKDADFLDYNNIVRVKSAKKKLVPAGIWDETVKVWISIEEKLELPESKLIFRKDFERFKRRYGKEFPELNGVKK